MIYTKIGTSYVFHLSRHRLPITHQQNHNILMKLSQMAKKHRNSQTSRTLFVYQFRRTLDQFNPFPPLLLAALPSSSHSILPHKAPSHVLPPCAVCQIFRGPLCGGRWCRFIQRFVSAASDATASVELCAASRGLFSVTASRN